MDQPDTTPRTININELSFEELTKLDTKNLDSEQLKALAVHASTAMNYHGDESQRYREQWRRFLGAYNLLNLLPVSPNTVAPREWRVGDGK